MKVISFIYLVKEQLFISLTFSTVFLVSTPFVFALILVVSFSPLTLGIFCSYLRCEVRFYHQIYCFLMQTFIATHSLSELVMLYPISFGMLYFHFICLKIFLSLSFDIFLIH